jgi:hypothetical protein
MAYMIVPDITYHDNKYSNLRERDWWTSSKTVSYDDYFAYYLPKQNFSVLPPLRTGEEIGDFQHKLRTDYRLTDAQIKQLAEKGVTIMGYGRHTRLGLEPKFFDLLATRPANKEPPREGLKKLNKKNTP